MKKSLTKVILCAGALTTLGLDSIAQITKLQDFENRKSATIGTFQGITYREGGFSGLCPIPNTNGKEFWTVSDRGVNVDAANANTASCRPTYDKIYGFPSYSPKIHRILLEGDSIKILETISIKRPNGTGATGVINPTGFGSTALEVASTDTVNNCANFNAKTVAKDVWGIDSEGIVVDKDGNFWICEEGGPTIWKVARNGVVISRYTPYPKAEPQDIQIDSVFKYRRNNRGFEGITITPNGKVYAFIQSPMYFPASVSANTRIHRILEIDPRTNATRMFAYVNDGAVGAGTDIRPRDWKIGDAVAMNDTTMLVLEAAARGVKDEKRLYKINISGATPLMNGLSYTGKSAEGLLDEAGLTGASIIPVKKTLVMDLLANGWPSVLDKAEGIAILNDSTIAIGNDNDYGQYSPLENGVATATNKSCHVITYRLSGANKLMNLMPAGIALSPANGPSTQVSPYLIADKPGVKLTSLLTVGDSVGVNNYKMVGIADGTGAYDNGNGTFTFLVNHELGADKGIVRAHGAKGAFVSKWTINKSDLTVLTGEDLIKNVYGWNTANQANEASTMTYAFQRFCSADLPAVSAYYNAKTGLGTMERIFMNGEEGGSNGYAVGHVSTGANAGNSYVLGKFNLTTNNSGLTAVGGWENLIACPFEQDKTVVIGTNDGGTGIMANSVAVYVGTKTNTGTEVEKAGLNNGVLKFINVAGSAAEIANSTTRATNITSGTAFTLSGTAATTFSRPEDGQWDPKDPSKFYFVTTDRLDQVADGVGAQIGRSRLWRLNFADITNPDLGGTIDLLIDGTEGVNMLDNMTIDNYGHVLMQEDPGNAAHNAKIWQYSINGDSIKVIAKHDPARYGDIGIAATAPFNQDEESSGIIDMEEILGPGNFLFVDQNHYSIPGELVEGGQMLKLFNPDTYAAYRKAAGIAKSTNATPYLLPTQPGVKLTSLLTVGDSVGVNNYKMVGIADGTGAYDNGNGTFTFLVNHELGADKGIVRAHGAKGAFVSKWTINKSDLTVLTGEDLIKNVYGWNTANQANEASTMTYAFQRFCSADLPAVSAYYNAKTGLGTMERIFMNGEEGGSNGYTVGHVSTGANAGNSYVLGKFNLSTNNSGLTAVGGWENLIACPFEQDKTVVIGTNDGGTGIMANSVAVYVGTKTNSGTEVDKAGLNNGTLKFINVAGSAAEIVNSTTRATNITSGTAFTLSGTAATTFSRPEDGQWDPKDPSKFYFVTTDRLDQVADGVGAQIGRSRLWRLNFTDITNPDLGGTIDMLIDGTEGVNMLDNMTIDNYGHVLMQEDPGNAAHNAKIWQYSTKDKSLKIIAKHDPARYGDIGIAATAPFNQDEESSGIIDMEEILGPGNFLFVDQNHYSIPGELVEGGQMLKLFNPDTYAASQVLTSIEPSNSTTLEGVSLYPNPAGDAATVSFTLEQNENVEISIVDNQGNQVIAPITKSLAAGEQKVTLNTASLSSGVYVIQVATSTQKSRIKAVIIK
ncbi:MAG: putative phytase [Bacteroidota bacterium]|jgi:hypothetical protein